MCFANTAGVLTFDGYSWNRLSIPGQYICRSVLADGGRLYVGSFEQFGYFVKNDTGKFQYIELSSSMDKSDFKNSEFWNIVRIGEVIYFQSFDNVFGYNTVSGEIARLPMTTVSGEDFQPLNIFSYGGELFAQRINGDLCRASGSGWECVISRSKINSNVVGICDDILVTESAGLFKTGADFSPKPFATEADKELSHHKINRACVTHEGDILIGTIGGGLYLLSNKGKLLWHITREDGGICNNSVLGLYADREGNIWAMLDDGISLIHTSVPYSYAPGGFLSDIGMVYSIGSYNGRIIAAGNQGAYEISDADGSGNFKLIPGTKGQNWCVRSFDDQVFIGGNDQTIVESSDGTRSIINGSATDFKRGIISGRDAIVQSSYYRLSVFLKNPETGKWEKSKEIDNFGAPILQVEIAADGTIWASHFTRGIFRIELSQDLSSVRQSEFFYSLKQGHMTSACYVMKIRERVVFADDESFYTYDEHSGKFVRFEDLNQQLPYIKQARSATHIDINTFWVSCADAYYLVRFDNGKYTNLLTIPLGIFPRATNGVNPAVFTDIRGRSYFTLNGGIGCVDIDGIPKRSRFKPELEVAYAGQMSVSGESVQLPCSTSDRAVDASEGNLRLILQYPEFDHRPLRYRFTLERGSNRSYKILTVPEIMYPKLSPGSYSLDCEVLDENGGVLGQLTYRFKVPRPWPLRWWAIMCYIIVLIASGYGLARYYARRRLLQERAALARERELRNEEIHRQRLVIAEQEKRLLEKELTAKGKELASMALDAYSRQSVIDELRRSLHDAHVQKGADFMKTLFPKLQSLSNTDTTGSEFWSVFERNFDLIHEHFFRNLRLRYPQLSSQDLRMCALIRLNLSTKDIARFQSITVRGVETARYRLRKKLNLSSGTNLTAFLIDFSGDEPATKKSLPEDDPLCHTDS